MGSRLKRLRKKPVKASAIRNGESSASPRAPDDHRAEGAEDRAGERDARFLPGIRRHLLHPDDGAEEGDEERRRSRHALAAELEDVAELVHEDQKDEADGEPPAPDPRVGRDRDEHRPRGREDLELEEREREELELRKEGADRRERRDQLLPDLLPARLRMDRLVLTLRLRLVERIVRLALRGEWAHVRFIVASGRSLEPPCGGVLASRALSRQKGAALVQEDPQDPVAGAWWWRCSRTRSWRSRAPLRRSTVTFSDRHSGHQVERQGHARSG